MSYTTTSSSINNTKTPDITINIKDTDLTNLTSSIVQMGNNLNGYLMQVFKEAQDKGLRSGYVLGHQKGYDEGKEKGYEEGKKEGYYKGKQQGKLEFKEQYSQLFMEEEYEPQFNSDSNPPSLTLNNIDEHNGFREHFR